MARLEYICLSGQSLGVGIMARVDYTCLSAALRLSELALQNWLRHADQFDGNFIEQGTCNYITSYNNDFRRSVTPDFF